MAQTPGPAPLDAATAAALRQLADIGVPAPVPWWPQTWGWAVLALLLAALAAWSIVRWRRRRAANRYRVEALAELAALEAQFDDAARRAAALAAVPPLLKRTALAAWPRPQVAALSGAHWVAFLRTHAGHGSLDDSAMRLLDDNEYRGADALAALTVDEARACARSARAWIEGHRGSA